MSKIVLLNEQEIEIMLTRLCCELIENHDDFKDTVLIGLQPRGVFLAQKIQTKLGQIEPIEPQLGFLDITFFRDDLRHKGLSITANQTKIDFLIEGKTVVLIDDVLYTGRSVRAALDAMLAFGRPSRVELLVLIDRKYSRDLPIEPKYFGKSVNTVQHQKVEVDWHDSKIYLLAQ
jgi:pyrimidine operon attenuation protein/uracil phosphoribosyltransferase